MMKSLLLAPLFVALAAAPAAAEMDDFGKGSITVGFQNVGARGVNLDVEAAANLGIFEGFAHILTPPGAFTSFFTTEAGVLFVGHTRRYLPIDLQPVMGMAFGMLMQDVANTRGSTDTDINLSMYMPVGLRYGFTAGGLGLQAEVAYRLSALNSGKADLNRWHFELGGHTGKLAAAAFYEMGAVYNGPGARIGLAF
ncbi:MAG: hypothetical protein JWM80_5856 [Cyanobacteria bacterium RYN_339]|nr:hypothetical protein [Cyanobacteria bacterium RYN_339]